MQNNPIAIKDGQKTVGLILVKNFQKKVKILVKKTGSEEVIVQSSLGDSLVSIPLSSNSVDIYYLDSVTDSIIEKESRDLVAEFGRDTEQDVGETDKELLESLSEKVKSFMDNPKGTMGEVEFHTDMLNRTTMDAQARHYVESKILQVISEERSFKEEKAHELKDSIYASLYGMGVIQEIDDDPAVGEIMINGYVYPTFRSEIYYVKNGVKLKYDKTFKSFNEMYNVFSRAIAFSRKELNNVENAQVEAMRSNRDRVNVIIPDASESYIMNIRKFGNFVPDETSMKRSGTIDDYINKLMSILVRGKANIGIGGEMGTGKTTYINYLLTHTVPSERKVVISSVSETDIERVLKGHDVVILNVDESKDFTFEKQIRTALRTTADRIIIPESRGEEFRQVYEANLKTKGNMFTAHALDDYSFLDMCVDMYMGNSLGDTKLIQNRIADSMDIVIIMQRAGADIRIKSISEVLLNEKREYVGMNPLYVWEQDPEDNTKGYYKNPGNAISERLIERLNHYGVPMTELEEFKKEAKTIQ